LSLIWQQFLEERWVKKKNVLNILYVKQVGAKRCELSYRRCETPVIQMLRMIEVEIEEIEIIQKELDNQAISIQDIDNR
jgi:hypothetical protein